MRIAVTADTVVRARIDAKTKKRAATALEAMGLSISDAIRLLMLRIADEKAPSVLGQSAERGEPAAPCGN